VIPSYIAFIMRLNGLCTLLIAYGIDEILHPLTIPANNLQLLRGHFC